jgi:hypothetical protein
MAGAFYCCGHALQSSQTDTRRLTLVLTFSAVLADNQPRPVMRTRRSSSRAAAVLMMASDPAMAWASCHQVLESGPFLLSTTATSTGWLWSRGHRLDDSTGCGGAADMAEELPPRPATSPALTFTR